MKRKMKPHGFVFFSLLATAFYLSSSSITYVVDSSSSLPTSLLQGRRMARELSVSRSPNHEQERHSKEVVDNELQQTDEEGFAVKGDNNGGEDGDELIYHVDYHGVSTHPNPTPKHPRP